jgi:hypothetical protein
MENCKTCKHGIFVERWGDYKCSEKKIAIFDVSKVNQCDLYEKGAPKQSKENQEGTKECFED